MHTIVQACGVGRGRLLVARRARLKQLTSTKSRIKKRDRPITHVPRRVVWRLGGPSSRGKIASCSPGTNVSNARLESLAGAHRRAQIQRLCDGQKRHQLDPRQPRAYVERQEDPIDYPLKISSSPGAGLSNALLFSCVRARCPDRRTILTCSLSS